MLSHFRRSTAKLVEVVSESFLFRLGGLQVAAPAVDVGLEVGDFLGVVIDAADEIFFVSSL